MPLSLPGRRLLRVALLVLAAVLAAPAPGRAGEGEAVVDDGWYSLRLGESKVGWLHARRLRVEEAGAVRWVVETEMDLRLARAGTEIAISESSRTLEDEAGTVLAFSKTTAMGGEPATLEGHLVEGRLVVRIGGHARTVDYPPGAVGPVAADRRLLAAGLGEGVTVELVAFAADAPTLAVATRITVGAEETVDVEGRPMALRALTVENDLLPQPQRAWVDAGAVPMRVETPVPILGVLRMARTEPALAKADVRPAEMFFQSLVAPDRRIPSPRTLAEARYRIRGEGLDAAFPDGVGQTVLERGEGSLLVAVAPPAPDAFSGVFEPPYAPEGVPDALLAPNAWLESGDEGVERLAAEAVAGAADAVAAARGIEAHVRAAIADKNFGTGFATAAEVARRREGDCTEHAVLAAAMARAVGLPSRVVIGLVYVEMPPSPGAEPRGAFGYHMWTEVMVAPDAWLPIDAAVGGMDATHLAMSRSDLSSVNPVTELVLPVLEAMGGLEIEVLVPEAVAPGR